MKAKIIAVVLVCLAGAALCVAQDANMGTWTLNEGKSKFSPGAPKSKTVVYEAAGDQVKVTITGATADGKPANSEWTGKFDGKEYPATGSAPGTRSYTVVNDHTTKFVLKVGEKISLSGTIVVAADGKTRTVTASGTGSDGKKVSYTAVYDKQ